MSELKGACIIGQSGGPTSVINASAYGVIRTALDSGCITNVYGAEHGIKGVLEDRLFDMSQEDPKELELLKYTPSSALGSCRYELRCVDFGEVLSIQKFAERLTDPGLNLENRALFFISQRDGPVVQQVLDGSVDPLLVDDNRRCFFRLGEDFHF